MLSHEPTADGAFALTGVAYAGVRPSLGAGQHRRRRLDACPVHPGRSVRPDALAHRLDAARHGRLSGSRCAPPTARQRRAHASSSGCADDALTPPFLAARRDSAARPLPICPPPDPAPRQPRRASIRSTGARLPPRRSTPRRTRRPLSRACGATRSRRFSTQRATGIVCRRAIAARTACSR